MVEKILLFVGGVILRTLTLSLRWNFALFIDINLKNVTQRKNVRNNIPFIPWNYVKYNQMKRFDILDFYTNSKKSYNLYFLWKV